MNERPFVRRLESPSVHTSVLLQTLPVAYYDAVLVYAHALHRMLYVDKVELQEPRISCNDIPAEPWGQGDLLTSYFRQVCAQCSPTLG